MLFLMVIVITITSSAQRNADLTVSTTGTSNLKIQLNGRRISLKDRSVTFENLQPGTYPLIIYQWQKKQNRNFEYVEVFNNTVNLTAGKHIEVTVLRFGKVVWDEGFVTDDDWNNGNGSSPIGGSGNTGYNGNHGNQTAVNDAQFKDVKKAIYDCYDDDCRVNTAKVVMKNNWFTINQIKELAKMLYSEPKVLLFIKNAYPFCIEKGSYFSLADLFYSRSTKEDFMKWYGEQ